MSELLLQEILSEVKDVNNGMQVLHEWKNEVSEWRHEMTEWKEEVIDWKNEVSEWRHEMTQWKEETNATLEAIALHVSTILEEVQEIKVNQERQGKVLETLSYRSLEHEADIRMLKRGI